MPPLRNERGQFRKAGTAEEEKERFSNITPPPPAAVTQRDSEFVNQDTTVEPPDLPPVAPPIQPPPLPQAPQQSKVVEKEGLDPAQAASSGASAGRVLGPAGAVVGAGLGFAAAKSLPKAPIGSFSGSGQIGGGDQEVLRELLEVQRGIARVGAPIKDAITTKSSGARL